MSETSDIDWRDYVVHLPLPSAFGGRAAERAALLQDVRYFLVVGSLLRPRRIVQRLTESGVAEHVGTYFNILDDPGVADREFNIEVIRIDADGAPLDIAIASHGIGGSGAEIVINELMALIQIAREEAGLGNARHLICGVGRSGTRGTLGAYEYGTVGISTASFDDGFDVAHPDGTLLRFTLDAAEASAHPWATGSGISTDFFWRGQGRVVPPQHGLNVLSQRMEQIASDLLWSWVDRGIAFVEMEDYAVHRTCRALGVPSVTAGAIIARRFDAARGAFVLDYDVEAKHRSELWPAEILVDSFRRHWGWLQSQDGPSTLTKGR